MFRGHKETAGYLHSIVHGRDSVYTAFTNRVGADPDVLLQLVHVGELGWASVQLERAGIINIYTVSCDITKKKVPAQHHLVSFTSDAEGCKWHFSLSMQVNNVYQMLEHPGNLSPTTKNIMSVKLTFGEEKKIKRLSTSSFYLIVWPLTTKCLAGQPKVQVDICTKLSRVKLLLHIYTGAPQQTCHQLCHVPVCLCRSAAEQSLQDHLIWILDLCHQSKLFHCNYNQQATERNRVSSTQVLVTMFQWPICLTVFCTELQLHHEIYAWLQNRRRNCWISRDYNSFSWTLLHEKRKKKVCVSFVHARQYFKYH